MIRKTTVYRMVGVIAAAMTLTVESAFAQLPGTITADPNAVELRKIWEVKGDIAGGDYVGDGVGSVGDIFGTGRNVWYVGFGRLAEERYYVADANGSLPSWTEPVFIIKGMGNPIVGDFWGTRHNALLFQRGSQDGSDKNYFELHAFRTDSNHLYTVESTTLNTRTMTPQVQTVGPEDKFAVDLDHDGADELVLLFPGFKRGGAFTTGSEAWIFKGGPDFHLDTPTVIIRGVDLPNADRISAIEDFDGDGHPDIVMLDRHGEVGPRNLYFLWGDGTLDGYNDTLHHRIVRVGDGDLGMTVLDCDGDHVADVILNRFAPAAERGPHLFRSGTGKSAHARSYQTDDADLYFQVNSGSIRAGYVNDTARRYELLLIGVGDKLVLFNGGPDGPDLKYDAWSQDDAFKPVPIPDADGDGWDDYIGGNSALNFNGGVAAIFAGGPYIPRDRSLGVEDIAVAGVANAISLWPNPAHDELHIAWRGDLRRMPRRFQVHNLMGQQVASGEVESGTAAAIWHCQDAPAGVYLVSIYDASNTLLTTARIIKH